METKPSICKFCRLYDCDIVQYKGNLDEAINELTMMPGLRPNEKRYEMYKNFTMIKYDRLGKGVRRKAKNMLASSSVLVFQYLLGRAIPGLSHHRSVSFLRTEQIAMP